VGQEISSRFLWILWPVCPPTISPLIQEALQVLPFRIFLNPIFGKTFRIEEKHIVVINPILLQEASPGDQFAASVFKKNLDCQNPLVAAALIEFRLHIFSTGPLNDPLDLLSLHGNDSN